MTRHYSPFILNTILTHMRETMIFRNYTKKKPFFINFAPKFQNFAAFSPYRADRNRASSINHDNSAEGLMVSVESPVVGGRNGAGIVSALSSTKGPFYLADGKSARLALMEPFESSFPFPEPSESTRKIKKNLHQVGSYAGSSNHESRLSLYFFRIAPKRYAAKISWDVHWYNFDCENVLNGSSLFSQNKAVGMFQQNRVKVLMNINFAS